MNTSGYIRGYMAKNMNAVEFMNVVFNALRREFEEEELTLEITSDSLQSVTAGFVNDEVEINILHAWPLLKMRTKC